MRSQGVQGVVTLLAVASVLLFLFTVDPVAVQGVTRPTHDKVASVIEGLKGWAWTPGVWSDADLDRQAALEAVAGLDPPSVKGSENELDDGLEVKEPSREDMLDLVPQQEPTLTAVASPSASASAAPREPCRRTMLFHFGGTRGFASEYNRFIRVAAVAAHFDYEVVPVATDWMYGDHLE